MRLERHDGSTTLSLLLCPLLVASLLACATADSKPASAGSDRLEAAPAAGRAPLLAGAAVEVITPDISAGLPPVAVAGFGKGRDATGVHDDLYARALVLQAGKASVALVALDLIGFFHDDIVKIREDVRSRYPEVGVGSILIASTHTHAGPDVIGLWSPPDRAVDAGYIGRIRTRAADAVAAAWRARRPARLSFASADIPRLVQDSRLPTVVDATALLMKVDAENGQETIATLLDFPSHPESLGRDNTLISSDYPWSARLRLEREFGGVALFFSGDIGGLLTPLGGDMIDPETGEKLVPKTPRATEAYGREVARQVVAAWRATHDGHPAQSGSAAGASGTRPVPATGPTVALLVRTRAVRVPLKNAMFVRGLAEGRIWPRLLAADGTLSSEVAVLTLFGEAKNGAPRRDTTPGAVPQGTEPLAQFACVPGEIYPELVLGGIQNPQDPGADIQGAPREKPLRSMMSGRYRFILGLCNDELGYIIPRSEWDLEAPFAYGLTEAQYGETKSAGPDTAPTLLDAFAAILP